MVKVLFGALGSPCGGEKPLLLLAAIVSRVLFSGQSEVFVCAVVIVDLCCTAVELPGFLSVYNDQSSKNVPVLLFFQHA